MNTIIINPLKILYDDFSDKIKGVKYGPLKIFDIELNDKTTTEEIKLAIHKLDHRLVLNFYDASYELNFEQKPVNLGDSGAFVTIKKERNKLLGRMGNHGGYKLKGAWIKLSENEIIDRIFKSRNFNTGKMAIESRLIRYRVKRKDGINMVYPIYHDISDKHNLCQQHTLFIAKLATRRK